MIDDKMAKMAVNTLKAYCDGMRCPDCAVSSACALANCLFKSFANYNTIGTFEDGQKPSEKTPKFDATLSDSPCFRDYINGILELEADRAGMPTSGLGPVKCYPSGTIKVWYTDDDGGTVYKGKAKCHPNDAFNPEIGIKLAVQRIVEKLNKPFIPEENEAYYYVNVENLIDSTINHNTNKDVLNIAMGNCFRKRKEALSHKDVIMNRIAKAAKLLEKLRDEGDE